MFIPIPFCHPLLNIGSDPSTPWTTNLKKPVLKDFYPQEPTGPTFAVPDSPSAIFRMFYTFKLLDLVTAETNKYAKQIMTPQKFFKFTPISKLDIEAFMVFNILEKNEVCFAHFVFLQCGYQLSPFPCYVMGK